MPVVVEAVVVLIMERIQVVLVALVAVVQVLAGLEALLLRR
jgi:hypothetical protein